MFGVLELNLCVHLDIVVYPRRQFIFQTTPGHRNEKKSAHETNFENILDKLGRNIETNFEKIVDKLV